MSAMAVCERAALLLSICAVQSFAFAPCTPPALVWPFTKATSSDFKSVRGASHQSSSLRRNDLLRGRLPMRAFPLLLPSETNHFGSCGMSLAISVSPLPCSLRIILATSQQGPPLRACGSLSHDSRCCFVFGDLQANDLRGAVAALSSREKLD